jgi:hypothetical protein
VPRTGWTYDADARTLTVPVAERSVTHRTVVRFSTAAVVTPTLHVADPRVEAGATQVVTGSGFPASSDVVLATQPDVGGVTVRSDASGAFSADLRVATTASGRVG